MKTKAQISCAVTAQLIFAFVFDTWRAQFFFFLIRNFKLLAIFYSCTGHFVPDLVGNPEDRFSNITALLLYSQYPFHQDNISVQCKYPRIQTKPLHRKTGVCRDIHFFLIFDPNLDRHILAPKNHERKSFIQAKLARFSYHVTNFNESFGKI